MMRLLKLLIILAGTFLLAGGTQITVAAVSPELSFKRVATTYEKPAAGKFLVAQRGLSGPYFSRTVVYLLKHDEQGTVGLIVNRPIDKIVSDVLPDMYSLEHGSFPLYYGGPVSPRIMVMLIRDDLDSELALRVTDGVYASSNLALLTKLIVSRKPGDELRFFVGQANWIPGQLEKELQQDAWFVTAGDPEEIFAGNTDKLWQKLINRLDPLGIIASLDRYRSWHP